MCVHHLVHGVFLDYLVTVDIRLLADGFEILLIAMAPIVNSPRQDVLEAMMALYLSDEYTFKTGGLKALRFIPYQEGYYTSIYHYTFSPYGVCDLMSLLLVDLQIASGSLQIQNGKFPGALMSSPLLNGKPGATSLPAVPSTRIQRFMDEIAIYRTMRP